MSAVEERKKLPREVTTPRNYGWTIVQHSGYGYGSNPQFRSGLETRRITTKRQLNQIIGIGGLVFDEYTKAEAETMRLMYPVGYTGLIPIARGSFVSLQIDGLHLYVPSTDKEKGA